MFNRPAPVIRRLCEGADSHEEELAEQIEEAFTVGHAAKLTQSSVPKTEAAWKVAARDCFGGLPLVAG